MVFPRWLGPVLLLGLGTSACSLFVETDVLQAGGGDAPTSSGGGGPSATSTGPTPSSSASTGQGGSGQGSGASAGGGGVDGSGGAPGTGGGGAAGTGGAGGAGGESPTWCVANAPADAFLCADFDTPTTGISSPPWSNTTFDDEDGSITLDDTAFRSAPAAARVELDAATEPNCGYQVLHEDVPGAPARIQIRFSVRPEVTDGDDAMVALFGWQTTDDTPCALILGLGSNRGFFLEQAFAGPAGDDQWTAAESYLTGWHDVVWSIDLEQGTVELTVDGQPSFFVENDDFVYDLSAICSDVAEPNTIDVRIGPHCEKPPLSLLYDDVVIAPW